ncbi:MAG: mercury(II) reductase [Candidatus Dormibacteria bacterium]
MTFDLAVVGSGSAGFAAAIAATSKGLSVVMIERGTIGGTCVNIGCIPSKGLLAAAEVRRAALAQRFPGIQTAAAPVDLAALIEGKDELVEALRRDRYTDLIAEHGWQIRHAQARFVSGPALEVAGERIEARHYLVATGATAFAPPVEGLAEVGYLTSTTAMDLDKMPESMIVVGGNYVGLELSQLFARLGSRVTLIEALPRLAPGEEPEISEAVEGVLKDEGVAVHTSAGLSRVGRGPGGVAAVMADGTELRADSLLMATGRRPNSAGLGLEMVGVGLGRLGEVLVDSRLQTANPRVWAAGDVTGAPQFVYVAGAHGKMVVDNAFFAAGREVDYRHLPRVTFTSPNIASVGLTEAQVAEAGLDCTCRVLPLAYLPRALVNRDTRGLVKIVAERGSGLVLGIHMIGANAGDAILAATYALEAGMTVDQIARTWAPYLTMSEGIKLAAQAFRTDVSKLSCCAA